MSCRLSNATSNVGFNACVQKCMDSRENDDSNMSLLLDDVMKQLGDPYGKFLLRGTVMLTFVIFAY